MRCDKCGGTFLYAGSFSHSANISIKNKVYFDPNIPTKSYLFACRCCGIKLELNHSNSTIEFTYNPETPHLRKYHIIEKLEMSLNTGN